MNPALDHQEYLEAFGDPGLGGVDLLESLRMEEIQVSLQGICSRVGKIFQIGDVGWGFRYRGSRRADQGRGWEGFLGRGGSEGEIEVEGLTRLLGEASGGRHWERGPENAGLRAASRSSLLHLRSRVWEMRREEKRRERDLPPLPGYL